MSSILSNRYFLGMFFLLVSFVTAHDAQAIIDTDMLTPELCGSRYAGVCADSAPATGSFMGRCDTNNDGSRDNDCYAPLMSENNCNAQGGGKGVCQSSVCGAGMKPLGACDKDLNPVDGVCCAPDGSSKPTEDGSTTNPAPSSSMPTNLALPNPLKYDTFQDVIGSILVFLRSIIVLLALVFVIIGAVLYITSAGNEKRVTLAKSAITAAMVGMAIGVAAPMFLIEIADILSWKNVPENVSESIRLATVLANVLSFLLGIVGVLAVIMLVVGGGMYLFSAGDEKRASVGKQIVTYSLIGITVAVAALVLVRQIALFFTT